LLLFSGTSGKASNGQFVGDHLELLMGGFVRPCGMVLGVLLQVNSILVKMFSM